MSIIDPQRYSAPNAFEEEWEKLFSRKMFVCESDLLHEEDAYFSYLAFGRPFTVRKDAGAYKNIQNICLHRSNLIDPLGQGRRTFKCNYHGWTYQSSGKLSLAPLAAPENCRRDSLEFKYLRACDNLLFIADDNDSADQTLLGKIGYQDCGTYHRASLQHDANWKLLVENVLENYHISFVHSDSFVPTGITSTSQSLSSYEGQSSIFELVNKNNSEANTNYLHAFIYPNLFISITNEMVGFMSHLRPIAPDKTILEWRLFNTPKLQALNRSAQKYVHAKSIEFTSKVLQEDLVLLNSSQIGIKHAIAQHQLQSNEERIRHFHTAYNADMNQA